MRTTHFRIAFGLWLGLVILASILAYSGRIRPPPIPRLDLVLHAVAFGTLAALADGALARRRGLGLPLGPMLVLLAAGAEEALQGLSSRRTSCLSDFVADIVGVVAFTLAGRASSLRSASLPT